MWTYILHWKKGLQYQNMICSVQQGRDIYRKIYEIWEASWAPLICVNVYHFNCVRKCNSVPEINVYDTAWCSEHLTALPVLAYIPPHWNIFCLSDIPTAWEHHGKTISWLVLIFFASRHTLVLYQKDQIWRILRCSEHGAPLHSDSPTQSYIYSYTAVFYFPLCFPSSSSDVLAKSLTWALINLTQLLRCTDSKS